MKHGNKSEKSIFLEAADIGLAEAREEYLNRACGGDEELRANVEQLLAEHERTQPLLDAVATVDGPHTKEFSEGAVVGPYKLLQQIGEGGFGAVFMAEQQQPVRRKVALKLIKPGMDSRDVLARFEAERQALALMDHPNIAKVFDAGTTESGRPYFVMELVKGVPVTEYCDKNRLHTRERLELFVALCRAVQHAHQKGVIHRDIKPSNILVTLHDGKPVPKVIDFGVSKALNQQLTEKTLFTRYGQMIGTPQYMSPEQAELSGLDVDTRSDVYSLGVVLYELLTGHTPLHPDQLREVGFVEMQKLILDEEPPRPSMKLSTLGEQLTVVAKDRSIDPSKLRQTIVGELDWIVMKALEKDRSRRYETPNSFADDVLRYLGDEPIEACPPSTTYRLRKLIRRHKGPAVAIVAVTLALVIGILSTSVMYVRAERHRRTAEQLAESEKVQRDHAVKAEGTANRRARELDKALYLQRIRLAHANILTNKLMDARKQLRDCSESLRDWEWHYLMRRCYTDNVTQMTMPGRVFSIEFGPTSDQLAAGLHDGSASCVSLADESATNFPGGDAVPEWIMKPVALSPDGQLLVKSDADNLVTLWNARSGEKLQTLRGHTKPVFCVAFSPDGSRVVSAGADFTARIWDLETGRELGVLTNASDVWAVSFSPDGKLVACGALGGGLVLWDIESGKKVFENREHFAPVCSIAFSPDGTRLASGGSDYVIKIWDIDASRESGAAVKAIPDLANHKLDVNSVSFNSTGTRIASSSYDGTVRIWDAQTGDEMLVFQETFEFVYSVAFSRDGRYLVSGAGDHLVRIYDATPLNERLMPKPIVFAGFNHRTRLNIAIDPAGTRLAAGGEDGLIRVWDLTTNQEVGVFDRHYGVVFDLTFGPKGNYVFSAGGGIDPDVRNCAVCCWAMNNRGHELRFPITTRREKYAVAVSPDNQLVAVGGISKSLGLYEAETGELIREMEPPSNGRLITSLAFSPQSKYLASVEEGRSVTIWKTDELKNLDSEPIGRKLFTGRGGWAMVPSFSHDETRVAFVDGEYAVVANIESGEILLRFKAHGEWANCANFSPDGRYLITGGADGAVRFWDLSKGEPQKPIKWLLSEGEVYEISITSDGKRLAAASEDGKARLWDVGFLQAENEN